jgi:signal transduction histidine kinase
MISSEDQVDLTISDNGHGFKLEEAEQSGGLGLLGIRERVSNLGGSFSIQSEPELGTTLHIRLEVSK